MYHVFDSQCAVVNKGLHPADESLGEEAPVVADVVPPRYHVRRCVHNPVDARCELCAGEAAFELDESPDYALLELLAVPQVLLRVLRLRVVVCVHVHDVVEDSDHREECVSASVRDDVVEGIVHTRTLQRQPVDDLWLSLASLEAVEGHLRTTV